MTDKSNISLLIERCKSGSTEAQFAIYKLFYRAMFNTAYRILNNKEEAEDAMQECFLKAFNCLNDLQNNQMFAGWLKQLVIRHCLTVVKSQKKWQTETLDEKFQTITEVAHLDLEFENEILRKKILQAMLTLKSNYRIALSLHFIEGYDLEEIAEILQINYGNCRTLLSRAKSSLKQKLEVYETI
nr:sigma-70 family RNA polymerase sigma factor [uncultured Flavobacterium sp.]